MLTSSSALQCWCCRESRSPPAAPAGAEHLPGLCWQGRGHAGRDKAVWGRAEGSVSCGREGWSQSRCPEPSATPSNEALTSELLGAAWTEREMRGLRWERTKSPSSSSFRPGTVPYLRLQQHLSQCRHDGSTLGTGTGTLLTTCPAGGSALPKAHTAEGLCSAA